MNHSMATGEKGAVPYEVRALGYLMLAVVTARLGEDLIPRGVPFFEVLSGIGSDYQWVKGCSTLFFIGAALALTGRFFQVGCAVAGMALVAKVLGNMGAYSNGRLFDGLLLLMIGLCCSARGVTLLKAQCVVLYFGATLSKLIDPDWWDGRFMRALFEFHLPGGTGELLAPLAQAAGIVSILAEAGIGLLLLAPRTRNFGVVLLLTFHTGILLLLNDDFSTFYYAVALSGTLLFLNLPAIQSVSTPWAFLAEFAAVGAVRTAPRFKEAAARVEFSNVQLSGLGAWIFLTMANLPVLCVLLGATAYLARVGQYPARNAILASLLACGLATWLAAVPKRTEVELSKAAVA